MTLTRRLHLEVIRLCESVLSRVRVESYRALGVQALLLQIDERLRTRGGNHFAR